MDSPLTGLVYGQQRKYLSQSTPFIKALDADLPHEFP